MNPGLRSWFSWLWKEYREQRTMLAVLLFLIPLGTSIIFHFWRDTLTGQVESQVLVPSSLAAYLLAIGAEVFGAERRHRTFEFARRLPGGLIASFLAKLTTLILGSALIVHWQSWSIAAAWALGDRPTQAYEAATWLYSPLALVLILWVLWTAMVSTWLPRTGAALAASVITLSLVALPFFWVARSHPYYWNQGDLPGLLFVFSAMTLLGLATAYIRGFRFGSARWSPFLLSAPIILIGVTSTLGYGAVRLYRFLDFAPTDSGFQFGTAILGDEGKYIFFEGRRSLGGSRVESPSRVFRIDLASGDIHSLSNRASQLISLDREGRYIAPASEEKTPRAVVCEFGSPFLSGLGLESQDAQGVVYELSMETGLLGSSVDSLPRPSPPIVRRFPGGYVSLERGDGGKFTPCIRTLEGEVVIANDEAYRIVPLSTDRWLRIENPLTDSSKKTVLIVEGDGSQEHPALDPPMDVAATVVVNDREFLALSPQNTELAIWNPRSGDWRDISWETPPPEDYDSFRWIGSPAEDRVFLRLYSSTDCLAACRYAIFDRGRERLERLTPQFDHECATFVGRDGNTIYLVVDYRRLSRIDLELGREFILIDPSRSSPRDSF